MLVIGLVVVMKQRCLFKKIPNYHLLYILAGHLFGIE